MREKKSRRGTRQQRQHPAGSSTSERSPVNGVTALQQSIGNRSVTHLLMSDLKDVVQRVPVTANTRQETLFNQRAGGQATARVYGDNSGAHFDMSRSDTPASVVVTVRLRFVDQARTAAGGNTGAKTVIPAGDPRRAWAQGICTTAPNTWNGRGKLVGERSAATGLISIVSPDAGGHVQLPLVFRATPVWDLTSPADKEIRVFGSAVVPGGQQHPIDAAHYYMNRGGYPFTEEQIYAHEYGHLIGLPDEYSQSNPQMHGVLHDMDPATSATRGQALDKETVKRMVIAALTRPLFLRLSAAHDEISASFRRAAPAVRQALGRELSSTLLTPAVTRMLEANLPTAGARLAPRIPALVAAAGSPVPSARVAGGVIRNEFAPATLGGFIDQQYWNALMGVHKAADVGGVRININIEGGAGGAAATGIWNAASAGPMAAQASAVADSSVGALQTGRVPPLRSPTSILRQLESLPAGWAAFSAAAPAALSSGTLQTDLLTALTAAWLARVTGGGGGPPVTTRRALAAAVRTTVNNAGTAAATNAVRAFLAAEITPLLQTSVDSLMSSIGAEVDSILATPAGALAAAAPRDRNIAAIAAAMNTQLRTQATAATIAQVTTPGTTAVNPGAAAPAQSVTYGTVNMMSDNASVFRQDQFVELANQFNSSGLRRDREGEFHAELT
jgi:hypothetical protein